MVQATKHFYETSLNPQWFLVDAAGQVAGRLASRITHLLSGKHLATYTPNVTPPVFVVVINASKLRFTGGKKETKFYYRHSGRPGGLKRKTLSERLKQDPSRLFFDMVSQMLPKNKLRSRKLSHLKVFTSEKHPYQAQKLEQLSF